MTISSVLPVYQRTAFAVARGEGVYLFDTDGRRYLDFAAGIAVNSLGHCHPHVTKALCDQAHTLWHVSNMYRVPGQEKLAERLIARSFADTAFFCNSGAEANECAIKMMRRYHYTKGNPERYHIITLEGCFHGRTMATISASGKPKVMQGFEPALDGFRRVPFGDLEALKAAITPEVGGILFEPILGEGGVKQLSVEYLRAARALCDAHDMLLMLDEVQCGVGRTGHLFSYEPAGIEPDVVTLAKGIGTGFPLGICLANERAASGMVVGSHGTTYGGNPLAMAVGNAVLDVILAPDFIPNVRARGAELRTALEGLVARYPSLLTGIRGEGLMLGLVTQCDPVEFVKKGREVGILTVAAAENTIRILPPLIVESAHIAEAIQLFEATCEGMIRDAAA